MKKVAAIIVAAGNSTRMGGVNKQFADLCGKPVIVRTLSAFEKCEYISEIIISTRKSDIDEIKKVAQEFGISKLKTVVEGGATRAQSVRNAVACVSDDCRLLAIHDGARPLITDEVIKRAVEKANECGAAAVGVPIKDTLKKVDQQGNIICTVDRSELFGVQTPQVFDKGLYLKALNDSDDSESCTDDCLLIEKIGGTVAMVSGDSGNLKITTPDDLPIAEAIIKLREG